MGLAPRTKIGRRGDELVVQTQRTFIRRNAEAPPPFLLDRMRELVDKANEVASLESLLGLEGTAARFYFEAFGPLFRANAAGGPRLGFDFEGRNRRPPKDPINALLSLGYALLTKDVLITLLGVGFDPYLGFFHQPRYGRPALALDVMEEFRPLIVDSVVVSAVNTGVVQADDFVRRGGAHHNEDQILIIDLGPTDGRAAGCISAIGIAYKNPERTVVIL